MAEAGTVPFDESDQLEQVCNENYNRLFHFALRLTRNQTEAEEITQTAFLRFLRLMKRKKKPEIQSQQAYLSTTIHNLWIDLLKNRRKEMAVSLDDDKVREKLEREAAESDDSATSLENRIYYKELHRTLPLKVILGGLSDYDKQLLILRRVEERSVKEIAELLDREVCQVRYDLQKLEAKIRYRVRKLVTENDHLH